MPMLRRCLVPAVALAALLAATPGWAISPQNPYRSFNLSGINYGSVRWERAQREGRRPRPSSGIPSRPSGVWIHGVAGGGAGAGTVVDAGGARPVQRSSPRAFRRWRR